MAQLWVLVDREGVPMPWSCRDTRAATLSASSTKAADLMLAGVTIHPCHIVVDNDTQPDVGTGGGGGGIEAAVQE